MLSALFRRRRSGLNPPLQQASPNADIQSYFQGNLVQARIEHGEVRQFAGDALAAVHSAELSAC